MALVSGTAMAGTMEDSKLVHPFFTKPSKHCQQLAIQDEMAVPTLPTTNNINEEATKPVKARGGKRSSKKEGITEAPGSEAFAMLEVDPNNGRRKRPKKSAPVSKSREEVEIEQVVQRDAQESPEKLDGTTPLPLVEDQLGTNQAQTVQLSICGTSDQELAARLIGQIPDSGCVVSEGRDLLLLGDAPPATISPTSNPKKILRFNPKTGTIGSPPSKKETLQNTILSVDKPSRSRSKKPKSRILIIKYEGGLQSQIGEKIDRILNHSTTASSSAGNAKEEKPQASKSSKPSKNTHPFFSAKGSIRSTNTELTIGSKQHDPMEPIIVVKPKIPESTRPKISMVSGRGRPASTLNSGSAFAGFGKTERLFKFPGAMDPAWPWKGMLHVRGEDMQYQDQTPAISNVKKSKGQAVEVLAHEELLGNIARTLRIPDVAKSVKEFDQDDFSVPPPCLRLPKKRFETGPSLQQRIRKQVKAFVQHPLPMNTEDVSEDELVANEILRSKEIHPTLGNLYSALATSLSPFDKSQCETQAWTSKYSPKSAAEVLQSGREAHLLKQWLQSLTIMAVETGGTENSRSRATSATSKRTATSKGEPLGKRKRKPKKLEDFIVSSDSEQTDLDELTDLNEPDSPNGSQGLLKRTVIRGGDTTAKGSKEPSRLANAVVISGPHGSGKTAAVYAVAKELDFEVFEINSSSRRSGKDVLEKVGDMTRNHLVQQSQNQDPADVAEDDLRHISDALAEDLKSGRQGTMKSFFKSKEPSKPQSKLKSTSVPDGNATADNRTSKSAPKQQKQSLILLEEVDVLYEDDKQFWMTIINLIAQSKRPFIMTCTDETVVPIQTLKLHGIFRFSPVPKELAVDYMLLVAANEGHVIRHSAIEALYDSRRCDFRASLTELDFWCRFTVGDCKGGLEWFYPRWPPGRDIDEHGHTVRVISEGTYKAGMGWLCQDRLQSDSNYLDTEDEILHELWDGWNLDVGDWQDILDVSSWAKRMQRNDTSTRSNYAALQVYEEFSDAISASDLYSAGAYASDNDTLLDTSLPDVSNKAREDYILGLKLLDAPVAVTYNVLGEDMSMWMTTHARKYLQQDQHAKHGWEVPAELGSPSEKQVLELIRTKSTATDPRLVRRDLSLAFDPISEAEKTYVWSNSSSLEACCFDRTMSLIVLDVAPYVRSIVAHDMRLQQDRSRLSNLLSEGGRHGKRMRTTRSAMSALEGGTRSTTRKDKYFGTQLKPSLVLRTGGEGWQTVLAAEMAVVGQTEGSEVSDE